MLSKLALVKITVNCKKETNLEELIQTARLACPMFVPMEKLV
jgi:hypothetical protein